MIKSLINPKTQLYLDFKKFVLSGDFYWSYNSDMTYQDPPNSNYTNIFYYSHMFLMRPGNNPFRFPKNNSDHLEFAAQVFLEIFKHNEIEINSFLRINANCVHPYSNILNTVPHTDHDYDHKNALIYLTNSGGCTVVENNVYDPKEDDVIIFGGESHYHQTPRQDRRVVLVATFI